jgi:hypothetical protein
MSRAIVPTPEERAALLAALNLHGWRRDLTAAYLRVSVVTLWRRMRAHGFPLHAPRGKPVGRPGRQPRPCTLPPNVPPPVRVPW